jgi:hypothetical protein
MASAAKINSVEQKAHVTITFCFLSLPESLLALPNRFEISKYFMAWGLLVCFLHAINVSAIIT